MKTVALVGLAETTRDAVKRTNADEVWALNWSYNYDFLDKTGIDRLFEMHPIWLFIDNEHEEYQKPKDHWKWLHKPHPFPIYMLRDIPSIPSCTNYPIDEIVDDIFADRLIVVEWQGEKHIYDREKGKFIEHKTDLFGSSFDYLLALAIHEKVDVIELYGFEMGGDTEYKYQKDSAHFFLGVAVGRGITIKRQSNSVLMKNKRYGYEGAQMIFRQDLERHLINWEKQRVERLARLNHLEGQYASLDTVLKKERGEDLQAAMDKMLSEIRDARDYVSIAAGAFQAVKYLIQEVDLQEPELELNSPWDPDSDVSVHRLDFGELQEEE